MILERNTMKMSSGISQMPTGLVNNQLDVSSIEALQKSKEVKNLVSWIKSQYEKAKQSRQAVERQWYLNMAMYEGRQYVSFLPAHLGASSGGGRLVEPPVLPHHTRSVTNRIRPIVRTELARLTSNKPNASVVPASSEDEDIFAAQAAEQVWESYYATKKVGAHFRNAAFWISITGVGFIKTWWDPTKNGEGDVCYSSVTPFNILVPDLTVIEIEEQPWVINVFTKSPEWVFNNYGIKVAPTTKSASEIIDNGFFTKVTKDTQPDSALVIEIWLKPGTHKLFPNGGMAVIVDDILVSISEELYQHGQYPFTKFDHIPTGTFYSESVVTDLISPQREYNRTKNQIIEAKNRMAKPQLIAVEGSIDPAKITTAPGQVIQYKNGFNPPQPLQLQGLPSYVINQLELEVRDMEDISSQHQVSRGSAPPGVTAATAISFLQERDDSLMSYAYQSVEDGMEKIAKQTLGLVVEFMDTPRIISITGVDGAFDSITLKGSEISRGLDIRMEAGSALPISKAAKQAFLLDMMKMGFIDPNKGLSLMDMGGIDKLYEETRQDERAAQRENLRMRDLDVMQIQQHVAEVNQQNYLTEQQVGEDIVDPMTGEVQQEPQEDIGNGVDANSGSALAASENIIPVNTWDNHQVHIDVHNRFRKSQSFDMLPVEVKQQFEAHVQMHAMALNQAAMAAMANMPLPPKGNDPFAGANNGTGTPIGDAPVGMNQFGPPGTSDGNIPTDAMNGDMQNG